MNLKDRTTNLDQKFTIALDGPSGSGKGTIGKILSNEFKLHYVQSSAAYRFVAAQLLEKNINISELRSIISLSKNLTIEDFASTSNNETIGQIASEIASIADVRHNINKALQNIIDNNLRILIEGRDIGTVVMPDADLKIYLTASPEARAQRRYKQLLLEGKECILAEIYESICSRDKRDTQRQVSPLKIANNALVIDSSNYSIIEVVEQIKDFIMPN